jgi:antitoxin VapB
LGRPDPALVDNEIMRKPKANKRTGATLSDAATRSLERQLRGPARPIDWKKVDAITRKLAAMPVLDSRSIDEILGYDELSLPS